MIVRRNKNGFIDLLYINFEDLFCLFCLDNPSVPLYKIKQERLHFIHFENDRQINYFSKVKLRNIAFFSTFYFNV